MVDRQQDEQLKIQNFLEKEKIRIERVMEFLNTKIPVAMQYQQTEQLILQEQDSRARLQEKIVATLMSSGCYFQQKMARIFDRTFFADLSF